ncbi:MAG: hypothetical protein GY803_03715, partial [Chloroflexi bacterium]|nr:hypothetical protein [Chloroflexota bacterium]
MTTWFDDIPVIGSMPENDAAQTLAEMGENDSAETLGADVMRDGSLTFATPKGGPTRSGGWKFLNKAYKHTSHAFGYIAPFEAGQKALQPITYAGNMKAQEDLKNTPITITLQRLRVKDYPGGGTHHILFDFYAQNQTQNTMEELHFNSTYRAREGEEVAVVGFPIFVGLNVGAQGVAFRCFTVNVKNDSDEAFLGFLDSGVFKAGLKLATTAQPALKPLSEMAYGMTKGIAARNRNVAV